MFTGIVEGVGARYCPSIEDKIVRFADKPRHQLFLEPEGIEYRRSLCPRAINFTSRRCTSGYVAFDSPD